VKENSRDSDDPSGMTESKVSLRGDLLEFLRAREQLSCSYSRYMTQKFCSVTGIVLRLIQTCRIYIRPHALRRSEVLRIRCGTLLRPVSWNEEWTS